MHTARRTHGFTESVIRAMTRLANEHGAINLGQGFPNFPCPDLLKEAAARAIRADVNQYAITWGAKRLRDAVARKYQRCYGLAVDPESEITVTCGATEAMASSVLALVDPGDEVVVFAPYYENYGPDAILCGARPVFVPMETDRPIDLDRLAGAFGPRTRAVIVNTPNNPTGRVLSRAELEGIAALCTRHGAYALTDEIYEHIVYEGEHVAMATLPGMRERTITVSGYSKTFAITGWRIGTIVAPAPLTAAIRKVHDFLTVGAPAPLQDAVATALDELPPAYYEEMARAYRRRRDLLCATLERAGFRATPPQGAYYVIADYSELSSSDDVTFATELGGEARRRVGPGVELPRAARSGAPLCALRVLQDRGRTRGGGAQARGAAAVTRPASPRVPALRPQTVCAQRDGPCDTRPHAVHQEEACAPSSPSPPSPCRRRRSRPESSRSRAGT